MRRHVRYHVAAFGDGRGRLNVAHLKMADLTGASPDLNTDLTYTRINPLAGLTYKVIPGLTGLWRLFGIQPAPTPLEIGCSNPNKPCLIESALVSDPPLRQVLSRTYELGCVAGALKRQDRLENRRLSHRCHR